MEFHFLFYILIFIYFFKYETIVSRNGLSLGYSERDISSVKANLIYMTLWKKTCWSYWTVAAVTAPYKWWTAYSYYCCWYRSIFFRAGDIWLFRSSSKEILAVQLWLIYIHLYTWYLPKYLLDKVIYFQITFKSTKIFSYFFA